MIQGQLVLASNSPRRRQMLGWLELPCRLQPADLDETPLSGEAPPDYVRRLARAKAHAAAHHSQPGDLVLAADTTVVDGAEALGKPAYPHEAAMMLLRLRGRVHQVHTALTVLQVGAQRQVSVLCTSDVRMRWYSDAEMQEYIKTGDPLDKAGAYGIQHSGFHPVEDFMHCFANVMGLPLCHLDVVLGGWGTTQPAGRVPALCLQHLGYECPVHAGMRADAAAQAARG